MKKSYPSAASLFGTTHFPAIDNQGGVGSCSSQTIAYNVFSNAYSRYVHSIGKEPAWSPRDNNAHRFSPKFTFNLSGANTDIVFEIIKEHGCLTCEEFGFEKTEAGASLQTRPDGSLSAKTASWPTKEGEMEKALERRISYYKQVWFTKAPYKEKFTTSEAGHRLLNRIKENILNGNAVVTGGYPGRWVYNKIDGCGTYGKVGESAIVASSKNGGGGHQVTLLGYDDDITATVKGVTLKGAFLIANSWGPTWMNQGYTWLMYDAINTVSEFEELNNPDMYSSYMFLTPSQNMGMYPSTESDRQNLTFKKEGTVEIYGKTYDTYTIFNNCSGQYLAYSKEEKASEVCLKTEKEDGFGYTFAFIPYADVMEMKTVKKEEFYQKDYDQSYWIYTADKEGSEEGLRMLDAGIDFTGTGRKVHLANFNMGRYPQAKSWELDLPLTDEFSSRLAITAGKDKENERAWALDQFCFLDYRKHIVATAPDLYAKVEIEATDRECFTVDLVRTSKKDGSVVKHKPKMFEYSKIHPTYCDRKKGEYVTFSGIKNGEKEVGHFAFSFLPLMNFNESETADDFLWSVEVSIGKKEKKCDAVLLNGELVYKKGEKTVSGKVEGNTITF